MILAFALTAATLPAAMYGVHRFERWSQDCEVRAAQIRAEDAVITGHPGADEDFAVQLRSWLDAGQGSAVAR
jgi:hypothetical protein